jgi:hypothetical protein
MRLGLGLGLQDQVSGGGGLSGDYLNGVVSGMEFEWDASETASYSDPSATVANLIGSPASGASQTAYDMWRGAAETVDGDEPTFSTNTFSFDGGDLLQAKAANTTFMQNINLSTSACTIVMVVGIGTSLLNNDYFFASGTAANGGLLIGTRSDGSLRILQNSGGSSLISDFAGVLSTSSTHLLVISIDGPNSRIDLWADSTTIASNTGLTFDSTNTAPSNDDPFTFGANISTQNIPSGNTMRLGAVRNVASSQADAEAIIAHLESADRHNTDYTP